MKPARPSPTRLRPSSISPPNSIARRKALRSPRYRTTTELYVVTGQAPRQLDLNITTVGRVLKGMQYLSAIHRGPDPMGMFDKPEMRVPITAIHLASDVPPEQRERIEVLRSDSPQFAELIEARRNRQDGWYVHKAGHIDICNISPIVRGIPQR